MAFDSLKFVKEFGLSHSTTHHHVQNGWVGLQRCPFCGADNYKFAIHAKDERCNCWKCGGHGLVDTIKRLCHANYSQAKMIQGKFSDISSVTSAPPPKYGPNAISRPVEQVKQIELPSGSGPLKTVHRKYLENRNYDSHKLEKEWNLKGVGIVPGNTFSMRIIAPITYKNVIVSYQGRDITGRTDRLRYKTCAKRDESRFHKHCLYGLDKVKGDSVVVTEGITKVWRLGVGAIATFGIIWTMPQAAMLLDFKRIFILFDRGEQAQAQAEKLSYLLAGNIGGVEILTLDDYDDPGDLPQEDADHMMKELKIRN